MDGKGGGRFDVGVFVKLCTPFLTSPFLIHPGFIDVVHRLPKSNMASLAISDRIRLSDRERLGLTLRTGMDVQKRQVIVRNTFVNCRIDL